MWVPAQPAALDAFDRVSCPGAPGRLIQVSRPQVIKAEVRVQPLTAVLENIWCRARAFTSAFKELEPIPQYKATAKLAGFLQSVGTWA